MDLLCLYGTLAVIFGAGGCSTGIPVGYFDVKYPEAICREGTFEIEIIEPEYIRENEKLEGEFQYEIGVEQEDGSLDLIGEGSIKREIDMSYLRGIDVINRSSKVKKLRLPKKVKTGREMEFTVRFTYKRANGKTEKFTSRGRSWVFPGWLSILPSLITVIVAIVFKQNILALFIGIWLGATFVYSYNPLEGLCKALDTIIINGLSDREHCAVIYFCLTIGGMIAVVSKSGGAVGIANKARKLSKSRRSSMLITWIIGVGIFFDDYASCLIAGSTMKNITGGYRVSREKLSFIIDTCAATISSLAVISSWIGVELTYLSQELSLFDNKADVYSLFIRSLPYRFYPILALTFCLLIIIMDRDFGPMLEAERRAVLTGRLVSEGARPLLDSSNGEFNPKENCPHRWYNAAIPFLGVILAIIIGMYVSGREKILSTIDILESQIELATINKLDALAESYKVRQTMLLESITLRNIFTSSSIFDVFLWASFLGSALAIALALSQKILSLEEAMDSWLAGAKSMLFAILILMHAWGLSIICKDLSTAEYLSRYIDQYIPMQIFPTIVFIMGAVVSFSTGSAWGTMAILFPLVIPLSYKLNPLDEAFLLANISSILSGSVWGNHSSPIADSCIMSSMISSADHNDHVKTQAVYALFVGFVSILFGSIPTGFGYYSPITGLIISIAVMVGVLLVVGRSARDNCKGDQNELA